MGFFSFVGDIVSGAADLVGDVIETGAKVVGGAVSLVGDAADAIGFKGVGNVLHTAGNCVSTAGEWANKGFDYLGKGAEWLYDKAEDVTRAAGDFLTGGLYGKIVDGIDSAAAKAGEWLTGRDASQHELYLNYEQVDVVLNEINSIAGNLMGSAADEFYEAIRKLNNVNGVEKYVGTVDISKYSGVFDTLSQNITTIGSVINEKAEAIKKYEESSALDKFVGTVTMTAAKLTEGVVSVIEDLGDGVVSIVGFVGGAFSKDFQDACGDFVKKEWSHDMLNFYYDSELAQYSAFTEDSGAAGITKVLGKTAGYLFAGGVMAGTGAASAVGAAVHASTTTVGATMVAGLSGLGSGTESGLNSGHSFNSAFGQGVVTGTLSAGLAFAGGKLSEANAGKKYLIESGQNKNATLKDGLKYVNQKASEGANIYNAKKEAIKELADGDNHLARLLSKTEQNQFKIDLGDGNSLQGYNDLFTNAGKNFKDARNLKALSKIDATLVKEGTKQMDDVGLQLSQSGDELAESGSQSFSRSSKDLARDLDIKQSADEMAEGTFSEGGQDQVNQYALKKVTGGNNVITQTTKNKIEQEVAKNTLRSFINGGKQLVVRSAGTALQNAGPISQGINVVRHETSQSSAIKGAARGQSLAPVIQAASQAATATPSAPSTMVRGTTQVYSQPTVPINHPQQAAPRAASGVTPKVVSSVPTASVGAAVGNAAQNVAQGVANSAANGAASLSNLTNKWTDNAYQPKEMPVPGTTPKTIIPGNGSVTPVPTSNGKLQSNVPITYHSGGEYNENGYVGDKNTSLAASLAGLTDNTDELIDEIMRDGSRGSASKIPVSNNPLKVGKKGGAQAAIPIAAGFTTAAAAGLGAKAYSDIKRANEEAEEEEYEDEYEEFDNDGIIVDGWTDEDVIEELNKADTEDKFINIDKQDEDEYYRISENPLPIVSNEEESFA